MITYFTPSAFSIGPLISPVNAPLSSKCMFCAPIAIVVPSAAFTRAGRFVNGAQMTLSTPGRSALPFTSAKNASASETVLNIFQLPAMIGVRMLQPPSYLSSNASTPGSFLPSMNSSDAPPPVEIWSILSFRSNFSTAAAESPPPMTV